MKLKYFLLGVLVISAAIGVLSEEEDNYSDVAPSGEYGPDDGPATETPPYGEDDPEAGDEPATEAPTGGETVKVDGEATVTASETVLSPILKKIAKTLDKILLWIKANIKASGSVDVADTAGAGLDITGAVDAVVGGLTKKGHKKHPKTSVEAPAVEEEDDDDSEVIANAKAVAEGLSPL